MKPVNNKHDRLLLYSLYRAVVTIIFVLLYPFVFIANKFQKGKSCGLAQRFGVNINSLFQSITGKGSVRIWIHAASVGEVQAARILIDELKARHNDGEYFVTTMTVHGKQVAEIQLPSDVTCFLAPLDVPIVVRRFLEALKPDLYVCIETELWPSIFIELQDSGIPSMIVNGRMSPKSFQRYSMIRGLIGAVLGKLSATSVISEVDGQRFKKLGASKETLRVTGNIKYDFPAQDINQVRRIHRELLQVGEEKVFICGSTRTGEEEILLPVFRALERSSDGQVIWVIAPRHLERLENVQQFLIGNGLKFDTYSNLKNNGRSSSVILVDTLGDLGQLYSAGDLVFVGGSLVNKHGHNIMEAARWGIPVFYGPSIDDFIDAAEILEQEGGAFRIEDGEDLAKALIDILQDETKYKTACEKALNAVSLQRGAGGRQADMVMNLLSNTA